MDEILETSAVDDSAKLVVHKDHSEPMTMSEFAGWLGENIDGMSVTNALKQAAFMLCCDVISQDIAKSTLRLRERLDNGTSKVVLPIKHPIAGLLAMEPNHRHTWYEYKEMTALWSCFTSNSYAAVLRNKTGDPLELIPFQTGRVREYVEGRDIFYEVTAATEHERGLLGATSARFPERDFIHVRGRMIDGLNGYSTLTAGKETLENSKSISDYRGNLFGDEGQMRGVFTKEGDVPLPQESFDRLRSQFKLLMNRFRQLTEPIILEAGIKFDAISSNPQEVELTKQFEAQVNEVCRLLRVPPHKVFALGNVKYENLETLEKAYVGDTLVPIAERFEERYNRALLTGKDRLKYFFEHDRSEMTLRDTKVETERVIRAVERGVITIDEARAVLGYNPLPNKAGQTRTIPVNMTVVGEKNEVLIGGTPAEPEKDEPVDPDASADDEKGTKKSLRLISSN